MEDHPDAVISLGDSAYNRSEIRRELGLGLPVPLSKDGIQQRVRGGLVTVTCDALTQSRVRT
jgi:hypothetical protein